MKLPAYPRTKPSGVEWLGDVPEHWDVKRLSYVTQCLDGKRVPLNSEDRSDRRGDYPYWGANSIVDHIDAWLFDEPLVLLGEDGAPFFERNKTVAFFVQGKIWVNNHAHVIRPAKTCEPRYLTYALNQTQYGAFIDGSTRDKLTQGDMNSIPVAYPSPAEQRSIAAFLDRETGRVDRLVAKKRELIERLKEKHTALISRTVTRGLPPAAARSAGIPVNPPLKPSGLEWLGDIPNDWKVCTLRRGCSDIFLGLTSTVDYFDDGGFPLVRALNIAGGKLDFSDARYISEEQHRQLTKYRRAKRNDVLLSKSGSIGTCALVDTDRQFSIYESIFALRAHPSLLHPNYLLHLLRSDVCQAQYLASLVGMGVGHLNMSDITEVLITLPPLPEQAAIAAYLDVETAKLDALVGKVEEAVERLQEYRTALITAAVTGKIDVRKESYA